MCFVWVSATTVALPAWRLVAGPMVALAQAPSADGAAALDKSGKGQRPALLRLGFGPDLAILPPGVSLNREGRSVQARLARALPHLASTQPGLPQPRAPPRA